MKPLHHRVSEILVFALLGTLPGCALSPGAKQASGDPRSVAHSAGETTEVAATDDLQSRVRPTKTGTVRLEVLHDPEVRC